MKAKDIQDALRKVPFRPFEICLDNGQVFTVASPDRVLFGARRISCVVADDDHFRYFDLDHVSSLGDRQNGRTQKRPKRR